MGKENVGQGLGLTVILIGVVLSGIGMASIFSDLSAAPSTPDAIVQALPSAAGPAPASGDQATPSAAKAEDELKRLLQAWREAWASQNTAAYLAFYTPDYQGTADTPEQWQANRKRIIGKAQFITIKTGQPEISLDNDLATLTFSLDYASDRLQDHGTKTLQLRRSNGHWLIEQEEFIAD